MQAGTRAFVKSLLERQFPEYVGETNITYTNVLFCTS